MLCDNCNVEATHHEIVISRGSRSDKHRCAECARAAGLLVKQHPVEAAHFAAHFADYMREQESLRCFLQPRTMLTPRLVPTLWDIQQQSIPRIAVPRVEVIPFNASRLSILQANTKQLEQMNAAEFQQLIAQCLDRMGFEVHMTGHLNARDGGIDIIAKPRLPGGGFGSLIAVQCEHHQSGHKTGRNKVADLLRWKGSCFQMGVLVTNTDFTSHARFEATQPQHRGFLRLRGFEHVAEWIRGNYTASVEWSELPKRIELAPGVWIDLTKLRSTAIK